MNTESRRTWLTGVGVGGTILIAAGAFVLSFTALTDLAGAAGIRPGLTWIWPLIVDGLIVVSTIGAVALAGRDGVWYCWSLLILASGLSVTANAIHATLHATQVAGWLASVIAAVPPLVLLAVTHLTVIIGKPAPDDHPAKPFVSRRDADTTRTRQARHQNLVPASVESPSNIVTLAASPGEPDRLPHVPSGLTARDFVVGYLRAKGGTAPANQVTQAGRDAGFTTEQMRVARRRCTPPITSTDTPNGWTWTIEEQTTLVCA